MAATSESTVRREYAPAASASPQVFGNWLLERELGRGGMGSVWLARHAALGLRAAVKILRPDLAGSPEHAQRFVEEARTSAMLRHPNVVQVYDLFVLPDGRPCFAMEYVEGRTLEEVAGNAPMEPERARALLLQVAGALAEAHFRGLVHRDVKAQNVMVEVGRDGAEMVKLLDFGIARRSFQEGGLTAPGTSLGTPHYMAPEQAVGGQVDFRADVYALGVLAHRLLNGRVPFEGSVSEVLAQQVQAEPPPLVAGSEALRKVVRRAMAKRPADRFDTAGEFARALREAPAEDAEARGPEVLVARGRVELRYSAAERLHSAVGHGLVRRRLFVRSERLPSTPQIDLVADAPGAEPVIVPARVVASFDGEDAERFGITPGFALELDTAALDPAPVREPPPAPAGGRRTRAERYRRRFAVSFGPPGAPQNAGFTTNLSATGLAVSTQHPQPVGTRLSVTFAHVDHGPKLQGYVVWSKAPAVRGGNGLMGVRIDGADEPYFQLLLEAAKAAAGEKGSRAEQSAGVAPKRAGEHGTPQVMVVEDNRDIRLLLNDAFRGDGYEVLLCPDGGLALAAMERLRKPCAVVLDLTMPLVNGWRVFEALKASPAHRDLPIVVLSAHPDARQLAGAHVVPKPFELESLTKLVRRLVTAP